MPGAVVVGTIVIDRLAAAERRMLEFLALGGGNIAGAPHSERQQLTQEFFFHLVGSIEMLAQVVNEERKLGINPEGVSVMKIANAFPSGDMLRAKLSALYANPRRDPFPPNPYNDEGYIYRMYNYRHQVTHRGVNAFLFTIGGGPPGIYLILDPRNAVLKHSAKPVQDEWPYMLKLVRTSCTEVLGLL